MHISWFRQNKIDVSVPLSSSFKLPYVSGIRYQIKVGFFLTLTIMTLGVVSSRVISDHVAEPFHQKSATLNKKETTLINLQIKLATLHWDEEDFLSNQTNLMSFITAQTKIVADIEEISQITNEIIQKDSSSTLDIDSYQQLVKMLPTYQSSAKEYRRLISSSVDVDSLTDVNVNEALILSQRLKGVINSSAGLGLNQLSQQLGYVMIDFQSENKKIAKEIEQVEALEVYIFVSSLLISLITASLIAWQISRAIAIPLEAATAVAQKFAETEDATLRVPVTTGDETGKLATALNQLIEQVSNSTYQLKQAQSQLIQSEKMSGLGQMVAGVAHEVNNPVNFIHGNLQHTEEYITELLNLVQIYQTTYPTGTPEINQLIDRMDLEFLQQDLPKILASMRFGTERIRNLVLSLRNFSRLDEAEVKNVDIHEGLRSTLLILSHRLQDQVQVIENFGELPLIDCYPSQLNQVFINIIGNAIDSFPTTQSDRQITITTKQLAYQQVQVRIKDNGSGILPEVQSRIFDPFFTTKPIGQGTGLGLSISYQIIERHRGIIQLNSQVDYGTEFVINLPVAFSGVV
jgi:two-component system, NtrC family, sensor kinase